MSVSASDKVSMPDTLGHTVGPERFEMLAKVAGNEVSTSYYTKSCTHIINKKIVTSLKLI